MGQGNAGWLTSLSPREITVTWLGREGAADEAERDRAWNQKSWRWRMRLSFQRCHRTSLSSSVLISEQQREDLPDPCHRL